MRLAPAALLAAALLHSCTSTPAATPVPAAGAKPCAGITTPRRLTVAPVPLPSSLTAAHLGGIVVDDAVIAPDGAVSDIRYAGKQLELLAPFGQKSLQDSRFQGGTVDGHPTAMRVRVSTAVGTGAPTPAALQDDSVWAHVPGTTSREAAWQLAGSVDRLTIVVHLVSPLGGAQVVAVAPSGQEKELRKIAPADHALDLSETIATGRFLEAAGDYRLELRAAGKTLAWTTVTIADDFKRAIVNACEPL